MELTPALFISENGSFLSLAVGFLTAGFIGSWHCALMCGPAACFMAEKEQLKPYHLGRLIGYVVLGSLAGGLSYYVIEFSFSYAKLIVSAIALILVFSFLLRTQIIFKVHKKLGILRKFKSGLPLGLASALLPCGWLYSFVAAAFASRSPYAGAFVMALFWLTTLPSLSLAPLGLKHLIQKSSLSQQKIAQAVLLVSSLFSLGLFFVN